MSITQTLPPIGAPVVYAGALGRIKRLHPKALPEFAEIDIAGQTKNLRLICLTEKDGLWLHERLEVRSKKAERVKQALRWKTSPIQEPESRPTDLLLEHYERLATFGFTKESFTRLCEANDLSLREGYAEIIRAREWK